MVVVVVVVFEKIHKNEVFWANMQSLCYDHIPKYFVEKNKLVKEPSQRLIKPGGRDGIQR